MFDSSHVSEAVVEGHLFHHGFAHGKLYDMDIIRENNIRFDEKMPYKEDLDFMLSYMNYIENIVFIPFTDYNYYIRGGDSLSSKRYPFNILAYVHRKILDKEVRFLQAHFSAKLSEYVDNSLMYGMQECIESIYKNGYTRKQRIEYLKVIYQFLMIRKSGFPDFYKSDGLIKMVLGLKCFDLCDLMLKTIYSLRK